VKRNRKRTIQRLEAKKAAAAAAAAAPKPAPSKRCQRIKDSMFQMSNGEHAELLHLIKTGGFVFGFPPGPDTSEWKDTDPWCEFKFPVKASSPSAKIIAYMKHYLERTVPFHIRELVRKPPLRLFINKVAGGVSRWHFDSVPEGSAESSVGRHSWTVAAHIGDRGSVGLHIEEEGEEALNSSRIALDSHIVYGFPGYRILHKTSARFTKEVERYSIVCFFYAKPAIDSEINKLY